MRMGERDRESWRDKNEDGERRAEDQGGRVPTDARQLNSIAKKFQIRTWVATLTATGLNNSSHQLEKRRGICRIGRLLGQFDVGRCDFARLIAVAECVTWVKCGVLPPFQNKCNSRTKHANQCFV